MSVIKNYTSVAASGNGMQQFDTGSIRDSQEGKGRFDLIPFYALERVAKHFENGAAKYGDRNWEKGQPLSRYVNSAIRHISKYMMGFREEYDLAAAAWNILCLIETEYKIYDGLIPKDLDDLPTVMSVNATIGER